MKKTLEQIVLEGQAAKCPTLEELYLLWMLMQQMEEEPFGQTCYGEIDPRSFHIDGVVSPGEFTGTLYILKEANMRKTIQKGTAMPVVSDVRRDFLAGRSPSGEVEYLSYLAGMQRILNELAGERTDGASRQAGEQGQKEAGPRGVFRQIGILYMNKRGGKGAADDISINYGQYYIEFIKRQIELIRPKTIVCCGEDIFRLIVMEVFQNKRRKKNQEIYMKWKDVVLGDIFLADSHFRHTGDEKKAAVRVVRMWNPAYRVNHGQYVSLEEYLKEFRRRAAGLEKNS